jgi:predicted deacylase
MALDIPSLKDCSQHELSLSIANFAAGQDLEIPVNIIAGRGSRPVLACIAGIHGDEAEGVLALLDLWRTIDPDELAGRLVLVPVANPPAFAAGRRRSPLDDVDLNRSFPGREDGSPSQRLARELFHSIVLSADLVFSLHSWYSSGIAENFLECPPPDTEAARFSFRAACATGFETIRITHWPEGLLGRVAIAQGVAAIEGEIGGLGRSLLENRQDYCMHVRRLMGFLKMYPWREAPQGPARICSAQHIIAKESGILRLKVGLGAAVSAGEDLAAIFDLHGRHVSDVVAPVAGRVGAHRTHVSVQPGDNLFTIFQPKEV